MNKKNSLFMALVMSMSVVVATTQAEKNEPSEIKYKQHYDKVQALKYGALAAAFAGLSLYSGGEAFRLARHGFRVFRGKAPSWSLKEGAFNSFLLDTLAATGCGSLGCKFAIKSIKAFKESQQA